METMGSNNQTDRMLLTLEQKMVTKIGIWNVRTLYESEKIQQFVAGAGLEPQGHKEEWKTKKTWKRHREKEQCGGR
jgi:hypothetical protein